MDLLLQVAVGRTDQSDVGMAKFGAADRQEAVFLDDLEQLGLQGQGEVADLVEQQGAAVGNIQ